MSNIAIRVEGLSKKYLIGAKQEGYKTLRDTLTDSFVAPFRRAGKLLRGQATGAAELDETLWALKDVSFDIKRGEAIGLIGGNGAGKSTLLKILSRITEPTEGFAEIHGRVSSLLEVGTGFHPELTGRENIYLNGAILGMKRIEINRKYDEMVAFAEVERFVDTPVKHYSSGMYLRLAFSVAAHMEPEILLVDEVLAVGDIAFQKKCLGKMEAVAKEGRTVLFVSHNMGAVSDLCKSAILLSKGEIVAKGECKEIISTYISSDSDIGKIDLRNWFVDRSGSGPMRVTYLETLDVKGNISSQFAYGEPITFNIGIRGNPGNTCIIGLSIRDELGHLVLHFCNSNDSYGLCLPEAESEIQMIFSENILNDGRYYITVWLGDGFDINNDRVFNCLSFKVASPKDGRIKCQSKVRLPAHWKVKGIKEERQIINLSRTGKTR